MCVVNLNVCSLLMLTKDAEGSSLKELPGYRVLRYRSKPLWNRTCARVLSEHKSSDKGDGLLVAPSQRRT